MTRIVLICLNRYGTGRTALPLLSQDVIHTDGSVTIASPTRKVPNYFVPAENVIRWEVRQ